MTTSRISGIIPLLFITLLCVGMVECGYLMFEHFVLDLVSRDRTGPSDTPEEKSEAKPPAPKAVGYEVILKRNLFGASAGEKPAPPPVPEKNTEVLMPTSLQIVLVGTITGSEGTERAIILDKAKKKQDLYSRGDEIQGALVKEIRRGKVILAQNGREEVLDISEAAKMRPRVALPTAPPPSPVAPVMEPAQPETNMNPPDAAQQFPEPAVDSPEEAIDPNATQIRLSRVSHAARGKKPGMDNLRSNATQQQGNINE